jgi:hypothetical protein
MFSVTEVERSNQVSYQWNITISSLLRQVESKGKAMEMVQLPNPVSCSIKK